MIVLILQYWHNDRDKAAELCRLIADIEPERRHDVRIRLLSRYDTDHVELEAIQRIGRRFDVSWARTEECDWTGWPAGPNRMAVETVTTADKWLHDAGWEDADGLFLIEPDVVPLRRTWLTEIVAEWAKAQAEGKSLMGSWRNSGGAHGHINGNCVIGRELARTAGIWRVSRHLAWDCHIAPYVRNKWYVSPLFRNDFEGTNATEELLRTPEVAGDVQPALCHGYKDRSAHDIARRWMNL